MKGHGPYREQGVRFWMVPTPAYRGNGVGRAKNVLWFIEGLARICDRLAKAFSPDVVICASTHPFDFKLGKRIAQKCRAALVFELHDIWPLSLVELHGFSVKNPLMRLIDRAERRAFEQSDGVVSLLPGLGEYLVARSIVPRRLFCVPNGSACEQSQGAAQHCADAKRLAALREHYGALILYAGGFARANAMQKLVELAGALPQLCFAAIGEGSEREEIAKAAPENLYLFDAVTPQALQSLLREADLLWLATEDFSFYRYGVSMNKVFDYMSTGRPVVFETPCLKNPISESGCGITVSPSDKIETRQAVLDLLALSPAERGAMGERGRRAVAGRYGYPTLAKRYRGFLEELINAKREG